MSTPQSQIFICSGVRLNSRYDHSIAFDSDTDQETFFRGKVVKTLTSYTYLRKKWDIKVEGDMEQARTWNYLYFRNLETGKNWYYFIDSVEYVSETTVKLSLQLDVIQTYLFQFNFLPCFIERTHVADDTIGKHTLVENLELGEYITNTATKVQPLTTSGCILVQATINPNNKNNVLGGLINGVYSGMGIYAVSLSQWSSFATLLNDLAEDGKLDAIVNMFMYPRELVELGDAYSWDDATVCKPVKAVKRLEVTFAKAQGTLDDYTPINNKLLCYPFNFLYISNNNGTSAVYKYERFTNDRCEFNLEGSLSADAMVKLVPQYYNGIPNNHDEGITLPSFPTCAWNSDVYKIWLAQNQNTHNLNLMQSSLGVLGGGVATGVSLATGNLLGAGAGVGAMLNGMMNIQNLMATKLDRSIEPPQAKGNHSVSVNFANSMHTFLVNFKSIDKEHAKKIDDYFSMYGYLVNELNVPNIHTRKHFTFIKTQGCHIESYLCNEDACLIESIFDNGITFWKNGNQIGNYTLASDNTPT